MNGSIPNNGAQGAPCDAMFWWFVYVTFSTIVAPLLVMAAIHWWDRIRNAVALLWVAVLVVVAWMVGAARGVLIRNSESGMHGPGKAKSRISNLKAPNDIGWRKWMLRSVRQRERLELSRMGLARLREKVKSLNR